MPQNKYTSTISPFTTTWGLHQTIHFRSQTT